MSKWRTRPVPMTRTKLRALFDDTFAHISKIVREEDGTRIHHRVAHEAASISGTVVAFLGISMRQGGRRDLLVVTLLSDDALIDVLLPMDAKAPRIDFPYEVAKDCAWTCPCEVLASGRRCPRRAAD